MLKVKVKEWERRVGQPCLEFAGPCFGACGPGLDSEHKTKTISKQGHV